MLQRKCCKGNAANVAVHNSTAWGKSSQSRTTSCFSCIVCRLCVRIQSRPLCGEGRFPSRPGSRSRCRPGMPISTAAHPTGCLGHFMVSEYLGRPDPESSSSRSLILGPADEGPCDLQAKGTGLHQRVRPQEVRATGSDPALGRALTTLT